MVQRFAQACSFSIATLQWHTPVPGLGPDLCHDRGPAFPRPWDCDGVTVALGVSSVMVSGLACGSGTRVPLWPIFFFFGKQFHYPLHEEKARIGPEAAAGPVGNSTCGRYCRQPTPE